MICSAIPSCSGGLGRPWFRRETPRKEQLLTAVTNRHETRDEVPPDAPPAPSDWVLERLSFAAGEAHLSANLFLPAEHDASRPLPAVTVTGTWTSVKEQMADRYAAKLAARGFAALSFDFTGFGLSGGEPREVESPARKAHDIRHAAAFLAHHPSIDADRIGAVAICASAMYASRAAIDDPRLRALVLIAPWLHDAKLVREVYGGPEGVAARLRAADQAAELYRHSGAVEYVPVADASDPRAAMPMEIDFYTNPARGKIAGWPNRFAVMAWREWLELDAIALAPHLRVPTRIIHSHAAAIPDGAERFYAALTGEKDLAWSEGDQFDFYDDPPTVDHAVELAAAYLATDLPRPHDPTEEPTT
jgi:dienelactone hydrolase